MRINEILVERRSADLYHNSNDGDKILQSGVIKTSMPDKDIMDEPTEREKEIGPRISLTRDFHYDWAPHKFVIDQAKLAMRQKIIPIDTENPTYDERRVESEEYVLKPITLDTVKAVILPDIEKGYENNLEVARLALGKNIPVYVGSHPRKLTQITADDVGSGPPKGAYAVITDPGFSPFEEGDYLTKKQLKSALDDYEDDFEYDILESIEENFADGEKKIILYTDPNYYGAEPGDYKPTGSVVNIPVNKLVGFEPDKKMDQPQSAKKLAGIVSAIQQGDKMPPVWVRKYKNGYQVIDGHHRFWGHKKAGKTEIPAIIIPDQDIDVKDKVEENFADGKNPGRKGLSQRVGIPKNATIAQLEKAAKAGGEKGRLARWQLNMRRGRKKGK